MFRGSDTDKLLHHRQMDAAVCLSHRDVGLGLCSCGSDNNDNNRRHRLATLVESSE